MTMAQILMCETFNQHAPSLSIAENDHLAWLLMIVGGFRIEELATDSKEKYLRWNDFIIARGPITGSFQAWMRVEKVKQPQRQLEVSWSEERSSHSLEYLHFEHLPCIKYLAFSVSHRLLAIAIRRGILQNYTTIDQLISGNGYYINIKAEHRNDPVFLSNQTDGSTNMPQNTNEMCRSFRAAAKRTIIDGSLDSDNYRDILDYGKQEQYRPVFGFALENRVERSYSDMKSVNEELHIAEFSGDRQTAEAACERLWHEAQEIEERVERMIPKHKIAKRNLAFLEGRDVREYLVKLVTILTTVKIRETWANAQAFLQVDDPSKPESIQQFNFLCVATLFFHFHVKESPRANAEKCPAISDP